MQETWVQPPGWEDPLEKGTMIHSSILAWEISWTEEPGRLESMMDMTEQISLHYAQTSNGYIVYAIWSRVFKCSYTLVK